MLYARNRKIIGQVLSDVGLIAWVFLWVVLAGRVRDFILQFSTPAQKAGETTETMSSSLASAADSVKDLPLVGRALESPLNNLGSTLAGLGDSTSQLISMIATVALVLFIVILAIPVIVYIYKWFPWRFRFVREATAGKKLMPAEASAELFALRALAHAPMRELAKITADPMGAWKRGDTQVIQALANLELELDGLALPSGRRAPTSVSR
ncbi:MAG: hypothetical protein FWG08_00725 [Propionibacteriaceae bacterium]|nr:hypothetical protein [Propionibacteriaceae bacterium]